MHISQFSFESSPPAGLSPTTHAEYALGRPPDNELGERRERETDRKRERERKKEEQTDRDRMRHRWGDRQRDRERDREAGRDRGMSSRTDQL